MKKAILILIIIAAIISGCQKYDLKKIYGDYTITSYTVNEADSLSLLFDSLCLNVKFYHEDVNDVNRFDIYGSRKDGQFSMLNCRWELLDHSSVLNFYSAQGSYGTGPFGNNITPEWDILDLTKNEIKMKTNYNEKEYIIELKRI